MNNTSTPRPLFHASVYTGLGVTYNAGFDSLDEAIAYVELVSDRCVRIPHAYVLRDGATVFTQVGGKRFDAVEYYTGVPQDEVIA